MYKVDEIVNTKEKLVSALETIETVEILNMDEFIGLPGTDFIRRLELTINGLECYVVWFHNLSNFHSKHFEIPFNTVVLHQPTWPTEMESKLKLQLKIDNQTVAVI